VVIGPGERVGIGSVAVFEICTFERDDGERFDVGSADASITQQINAARWTGARIQVWGELLTGVPAMGARHVEVDMGSVVLVACDGSLARRARARS
jgi:hypothetical protein